MPFSVNGTGTRYYGHALENNDGSYVVTEWITFLWLPLLPFRSRRLIPVPTPPGSWWNPAVGERYAALRVPLHLPHIIKGYAASIVLVLVFVLVMRLRR
jgi:hypothetical protein